MNAVRVVGPPVGSDERRPDCEPGFGVSPRASEKLRQVEASIRKLPEVRMVSTDIGAGANGGYMVSPHLLADARLPAPQRLPIPPSVLGPI